MNFELFIAKRIIAAKQYKSSVSSPIIKIAVLAIALGMIMMLIAVAAGIGLQQKIQEKVAAFNGHIINFIFRIVFNLPTVVIHGLAKISLSVK